LYPREQGYLLSEGFKVYILSVEEGFEIKNKYLANYNGKKVTIIYL